MLTVTTGQLTLRELTDADLEAVAGLLGDERVMAHYPRPKTRAEAQRWIDWNRALYAEHGFGLWAMSLTATGEFVGECGLTIQRVDGVAEVEIGYHVRPEHQGRGHATQAATACRDLARDRFGIRRLIAVIAEANLASRAVAAHLGMVLEKRSRVHGADRLIYAMQLDPVIPAARPDR